MERRFNDTSAYSSSMGPAPEDGRSAWEEVREAVLDRVGTVARKPNVEVQEAAERAMAAMGALHGDPVLYGKMKFLASQGMFRFDRLGRSQTLAWALWYCRSQAKAATALPAWKVPQALVEEGMQVRARMHRVMKHHLEFDAKDGPLVMSVTLGNDRRELANHLQLLGEVAPRHAALLATDRQWNAADATRSLALAREFSLALGSSEAVDWDDRSAVLYAMLKEAYGDVLATGRWLLREQPGEGERRFPKLVPYRGGARGGGASADEEEGAGEEETDDGDASEEHTAPDNDAEVAVTKADDADDADGADEAKEPAARPAVKKAKEPAAKAPAKKAAKGGAR